MANHRPPITRGVRSPLTRPVVVDAVEFAEQLADRMSGPDFPNRIKRPNRRGKPRTKSNKITLPTVSMLKEGSDV